MEITQEPGETKIAELDDSFFGQQNILRLDVAMDAVVCMTVPNSLQGLPYDPLCQNFRHSANRLQLQLNG